MTYESTYTAATSPYLSEEHDVLRTQVRRFVEQVVKPNGADWEQRGCVPREILRQMGALGLLGLRYPASFGGAEMDSLASVVLAEELGRSTYSGFAVTALVHTDMASVHIFGAGSDEQRQRWMPRLISGETICAVAVTEPSAGSDVKAMRTTARREGGEYVLDGTKMFITNGVHGDLYCVAARGPQQTPGKQAISMFVVERDRPGLEIGSPLDKHCWRSSDTAELTFKSCRIPSSSRLGAEGEGFGAIMRNFQNERIVLGALAMGEAQAALDLTLAHVKLRTAFGAPLWSKQAIRQRLALLTARVAAGRELVHRAAWLAARGLDAIAEVSMVKAYCGELVNEVMYACLQFHGASGLMRDTPIERMSRDARAQSIGGGATEVMLDEVAKRL